MSKTKQAYCGCTYSRTTGRLTKSCERHKGITHPNVTNADCRRELCEDVDRDQRDEAVEEIIEEAAQRYTNTESALTSQLDVESLRSALKYAYEQWCLNGLK